MHHEKTNLSVATAQIASNGHKPRWYASRLAQRSTDLKRFAGELAAEAESLRRQAAELKAQAISLLQATETVGERVAG
jgi:hypothetical protein